MDELFEFFVKRDGVTPLHKAALTGNGRLVKRVVSQGAETNITNSHGETALHYAAISGSLDAIQVLDPNASSLNIESSLKATPLHYAILGSASTEVLHYLCESGADLNVPSD
ncbi:ankyrin, partial [Amniculicola lignicola CBS 123094]